MWPNLWKAIRTHQYIETAIIQHTDIEQQKPATFNNSEYKSNTIHHIAIYILYYDQESQ